MSSVNIYCHKVKVCLCVQRIYLPGDNDVGGEMWDERTPLKVNRFNKYFKREELVNTNFVDYFTVSITVLMSQN